MARTPPLYTVTLDRLDGGEEIEDRPVTEVALNGGILRIHDGTRPIFVGAAWNWIEVRRIEYEATVTAGRKAAPAKPRRPAGRGLRTTRPKT